MENNQVPVTEDKKDNIVSFADLSDDFFDKQVGDIFSEKKDDVVVKTEDVPKAIEVPVELTIKEEEKPAVKEEIKEEAKLAEDKKENTLDFVIPGEDVAANEIATEDSWKVVSKELGFDITEDNFDEFKKGLDSFVNEKAKEITLNKEVSKLNPEAQLAFKAFQNGLTIDELSHSTRKIDELRALSPTDRVMKDLLARGWKEEIAQKQLDDLIENDKLDIADQTIIEVLNRKEKEIKDSIIQERAEAQARYEQAEMNAIKEEAGAIKEALTSVKNFMETPLRQEHINHLMKNWDSGKYHEALKDPATIGKFMMFLEFGEQATANLKKSIHEKAQEQYKATNHNLPPLETGGSKRIPTQTSSAAGNFGALKGI